MDLVTLAPRASAADREAVDAVLGQPTGRWDGGEREDGDGGHAARGGHEARERRHLLLPALQAVQRRSGWISRPALEYVCRRLGVPPADAYAVASFYALLATSPRPPVVAHLCEDLACRLAGSEAVGRDLAEALGPEGLPSLDGSVTWQRSPCLGRCDQAPSVLYTVAGIEPGMLATHAPSGRAVAATLARAARGEAVVKPEHHQRTAPSAARLEWLRGRAPQAGEPGLRLLNRVGTADPGSLSDYLDSGGYAGLRRALAIGPEATVAEVTASGLLGRGGAAFPTGRKWAAVAAAAARPHYTVCNADESEPGTFKDRVLMEEDPLRIVEAMTIEGFATGSQRGYLYVRGEYPLAAERLEVALAGARAAGLLGPDILGSGFGFEIEIRVGAGAYICGEETALFNSIEGLRGEPRNKPPFPVEAGLFGKPTAVNNVETLANVPAIVAEGGAAFAATGTTGSTGPKLFCVSGAVARPGVYEVVFGVTLGELLARAGGVAGGRGLQAILLGGAAGVFVGPDALGMPLTFEGTRTAGATLGSGVVMVFDDRADLVDALRRVAAFFRDESCGQCVPCRIGTVRQEELLARLAAGRPRGGLAAELALLGELGQGMRDASICGLGQTASAAIESAVQAGLVRFEEQQGAGGTGAGAPSEGGR